MEAIRICSRGSRVAYGEDPVSAASVSVRTQGERELSSLAARWAGRGRQQRASAADLPSLDESRGKPTASCRPGSQQSPHLNEL